MYARILERMRSQVRTRDLVVTLHAEEEMDEDDLTIYDVEHIILTGQIPERHKDAVTGEWKYTVAGKTWAGDEVHLVAKMSPTGKLVIITAYAI